MTAKMLFLVAVLVLQVSAERLLDMSHSVDENSPVYPGYKSLERERVRKGWQNPEKTSWLESFDFAFTEHMSTHIDAPSHFSPNKRTVDEIPIEDLVGPAINIDMKEKAASGDNAELAVEDVQKWIDEYGLIPDKAIIFITTGWGVRYHNKTDYFGTDTNVISNMRFPGLSAEVAHFFASHFNETGRRVVGIGIDTPSLDVGKSTTYPAHTILQTENIYLLEHVANIEELPAIGAEVIILPIKFTKGSGGPTRILARIPDSIPPYTPAPAQTQPSDPVSTQPQPSDPVSTPPKISEPVSTTPKTSEPVSPETEKSNSTAVSNN